MLHVLESALEALPSLVTVLPLATPLAIPPSLVKVPVGVGVAVAAAEELLLRVCQDDSTLTLGFLWK